MPLWKLHDATFGRIDGKPTNSQGSSLSSLPRAADTLPLRWPALIPGFAQCSQEQRARFSAVIVHTPRLVRWDVGQGLAAVIVHAAVRVGRDIRQRLGAVVISAPAASPLPLVAKRPEVPAAAVEQQPGAFGPRARGPDSAGCQHCGQAMTPFHHWSSLMTAGSASNSVSSFPSCLSGAGFGAGSGSGWSGLSVGMVAFSSGRHRICQPPPSAR